MSLGQARVTVLLPTRNRAGLLPRAYASALAEIRSVGGELIVLDNASIDATHMITKPWAKQAGVRVKRHARDLGMVGNWNAGLKLAKAPRVVVLHDDDALLPGSLKASLSAHERQKLAFSFGALRVLGPDGKARLSHYPLGHQDRDLACDEAWAWLFYYFCPVTMATVCFDTAYLRKLGGFKPEAGLAADAECYLRLAAGRPVAYLPSLLAEYGDHGSNLSVGMKGSAMSETLAGIGRNMILPPSLAPLAQGRPRLSALLRARYASHSAALWRRAKRYGEWAEAVREAETQAALLPWPARKRRLRLLALAGSNWFWAGLTERYLRLAYALRRRYSWFYPSPQRCAGWLRDLCQS